MTELERQLSAALSKLEQHYNDLHEQSRIEREQFRAGFQTLQTRYERALSELETELKRERVATEKALQLSADIVQKYPAQQYQINALSKQVEDLAQALPRLTGYCQSLSEALTGLQDQSAQLRSELEASHKR